MHVTHKLGPAVLRHPASAVWRDQADQQEDRVNPSEPRLRRRKPHAVIIVENMTVPPDRRVWQQAQALRQDGWRVTVITPKMGQYRAARERINGIDIRRHPLPFEARRIFGYAAEYGTALAFEAAHLVDLGLNDIDVVQICNPPDFLFAPALIAKKFGRAKIIFDHHDLTPELLADKVRGGLGQKLLLPFAEWAERQTFQCADAVISTNNAFRDIAIEKGGKRPEDTTVVYSGPDLSNLKDIPANPALKKGAETLLFWVGVMGSQDGLDLLLEAMAALKNMPGGERFHLLLAGDGPERYMAENYAVDLGIADNVTFAGFLSGDQLAEAFVTADIGVGSDPKNPFNDRLAMNKVMEYMAYSLPIAMFDLTECRKIAGEAAFYAAKNDPRALAAAISNLIMSPALRASKAAIGHERLAAEFSWEQQKTAYLDVYRRFKPDE